MTDNLPLFRERDRDPRSVCLEYEGRKALISFDDDKLVSLTDLWKAAGSPENKSPRYWLRTEQSIGFVAHLMEVYNVTKNHIIKTGAGKGLASGTFAHWQIAVAYAKYLSHQFHEVVNEALREWVEEKHDPALKVERAIKDFHKRGYDDDWIVDRIQVIAQHNSRVSTMRDHNCRVEGDDNPYREAATAINLGILGKTAKEIKQEKGLPKSARTRDHLDRDELASIRFADSKAEWLMRQKAADGNRECVKCVRDAVAIVKSANEAVKELLKK